MHTHIGKTVWGHREKTAISSQERPQKKPTLLTPGSWIYSFQNYEKINFCCLSHPTVFCYGSPSKLTQYVWSNLSMKLNVLFYFFFNIKQLSSSLFPTSSYGRTPSQRWQHTCEVPEAEEAAGLGNCMWLSQRQSCDKVTQGDSTTLKCARVSKDPRESAAFNDRLSGSHCIHITAVCVNYICTYVGSYCFKRDYDLRHFTSTVHWIEYPYIFT